MGMAKKQEIESEFTKEQTVQLVDLAAKYKAGRKGISFDKAFNTLEKKYAGKI